MPEIFKDWFKPPLPQTTLGYSRCLLRSKFCSFCLSFTLNYETVHVLQLIVFSKTTGNTLWNTYQKNFKFQLRWLLIKALLSRNSFNPQAWRGQGNEHGQWAMAGRLAFHSHHPFSDFLLLNAINPLHSTTSAGFNTIIVSSITSNSPYHMYLCSLLNIYTTNNSLLLMV